MKPARGFALVVLLVLITLTVGAGGIVAYFKFSPKPSPSPSPPAHQSQEPVIQPSESPSGETANWKTYIDKERGFQIQYPSNYKIAQDNSWGVPVTVIRAPEREISAKYSIFEIFFLSADYLTKYEQQMNKKYGESIFQNVKGTVTDITFAGKPAKKYTQEARTSDDKTTITIYSENKGNGYSLLVELEFPDERTTFDKILSTFKFTN